MDEAKPRIGTAADAYRLFRDGFPDAATESLQVAHLDGDQRLIAIDHYQGAADYLDVPTRAIVARALNEGSASLVIAHNHPGGDPNPSASDRTVTSRLIMLLRGLDIRLSDHLIFAGKRCTSFRQLGLL